MAVMAAYSAVHARHAEAEWMSVGEGAAGHQGGGHRQVGLLGELEELGVGPGGDDAAAGVEHRPLGFENQVDGGPDLERMALGVRLVAGEVDLAGRLVPFDLGVEDVLGEVDEDRAGSAGCWPGGTPRG